MQLIYLKKLYILYTINIRMLWSKIKKSFTITQLCASVSFTTAQHQH